MHARVLAERVLLRPCITEKSESASLHALAYVEEGLSQSLLVRPVSGLWEGTPNAVGGIGYPVLPISMQDRPTTPPPPPAATASQGSEADGETASAEEGLTLWEEVEEPWRLLEAHGILIVHRGADAMPTSVKLANGLTEWAGNLPTADGSTRRVGVTLLEPPGGWPLTARSQEPECGFCRFMKNGPCGEAFIAWEACIDRARDVGKDFVEMCGVETLDLKKCTDEHPEYYGELSGGGGEGDEKE